MKTFVALSFVALAVGYWAVSGGASFEPEAWPTETATTSGATEDVQVTRAEAPTDDLVAPPPEAGALTIASEAVSAAPEPARLSDDPVAPDEALAALAPDLAAPAAEATVTASSGSLLAGEVSGPSRTVTGDLVNVREGPGTDFSVVGRLQAGEAAQVIEVRDGWARVRVGATEGWMAERFLAGTGG